MEWIYVISAIASSIAAVLAWAAKLWWSKEYGAAKDEIIKAKEAQIEALKGEIESLKEMTPMKIREYFLSVRQQLEEYNDALNGELDEARKEIEGKNAEIKKLQSEGAQKSNEVAKLVSERDKIESAAKNLETQLSGLKEKHERKDVLVMKLQKFDTEALNNMISNYQNLRNSLAHSSLAIDTEKFSNFYKDYFEASATASSVAKTWLAIEKAHETKNKKNNDQEDDDNK
ncbi:MAG: hypothetical protein Q7U07_02825 [Gammaproteobacteria bacterium]|nr:hypothetical protein [Gammaproteobacteria bacterium]